MSQDSTARSVAPSSCSALVCLFVCASCGFGNADILIGRHAEATNAGGSASAGAGGASAGGGESGNAGTGFGPPRIALSMASEIITWEPVDSRPDDSTFSDRCSGDQLLMGLVGTVAEAESFLRSVHGICGELTFTAEAPYQATIVQVSELPVRGVSGVVTQSALCPPNQVMTGFAGRSGGLIDGLSVRCASVIVLGAPPNVFLTIGAGTKAGAIGSTTSGENFEAVDCKTGDLATGQFVRTPQGELGIITGFGLTCTTLSLLVE